MDSADRRGLQRGRIFEAARTGAVSATGETRANFGERRGHPGVDVRRTADDVKAAGGTRVNLAQVQAISIRMALDGDNLRDENVGKGCADLIDTLNFETRQREPLAEFLELDLDRNEFLEPAQRQLHDAASPVWNCCKKRKSFSKNNRKSSTPSLSREVRSTPIPNAKPEYCVGS